MADAAGSPGAASFDNGLLPVLVVDDDARMLRFVRDALAKAGYAPLATGDPEELPRIDRTSGA